MLLVIFAAVVAAIALLTIALVAFGRAIQGNWK
jgi:hypothetical protein